MPATLPRKNELELLVRNTPDQARHKLYKILLASIFALTTALPTASLAMDLNNGRRLYMAQCAGCHGSDGNSVMPNAPNFARGERLQQADFTLVNFIKTGTPTHPPFFGLIAEKEMLDVVGYLRNIR